MWGLMSLPWKAAAIGLLLVSVTAIGWGAGQTMNARALRAQLAKAQVEVGEMRSAYLQLATASQKQNDAINQLEKQSVLAKAKAAEALAAARAQIQHYRTEIERLQAAEAARKAGEGTCQEALAVIREGL